ncbi:MAG TPA: hypothetical protein VNG11_07355 [Chloroflexota bacterium]|nr:hypothetical protein [Chloroflexota bacterium]
MFGSIRQIFGRGDAPELILEGHIVAKPKEELNGHHQFEFNLDSNSDLVFRQQVTGLSVNHKRGDNVRVHYRISRDDAHVADVSWVESLQ